MWRARVREVAALTMVGEGLIGVIDPREHLHLWNFGPSRYRKMVGCMENHTDAMRLIFAAELGFGLWWALKSVSDHRKPSARLVVAEPIGPSSEPKANAFEAAAADDADV